MRTANQLSLAATATTMNNYNFGVDPRTLDQQMGLPMLDSNPGAPATIYLDFDGNTESGFWYYDQNGQKVYPPTFTTPVFDTDGNPNSFSASEQATIKQISSRVADDYAPFNINVSTDYYGDFKDKQALHVVIGGNNTDWLHGDASGVSVIGSFSDPSATNEVFVFDLTKWTNVNVEGHPMDAVAAIANTASHEAGHAFGLRHHSVYHSDGTLANTYDPGTSDWTPIMGENKASDRTTWYAGPTDLGWNTYQDDMAVIASPTNGFGYRADDHGDTFASADLLTSRTILTPLIGKGIINTPTDIDAFKFTTQGGAIQVSMSPNTYGPNLTPVVELWSSSGLIARSNPGTATQAIINATVPAGTYYVLAKSPTITVNGKRMGEYGNVGQYTVAVSFNTVLTQGSLQAVSIATNTSTASSTSTTQPLKSAPVSTAAFGSPAAGQDKLLTSASPVDQLIMPTQPSIYAKPKRSTTTQLHDLVLEDRLNLRHINSGLLAFETWDA